jgi:hypothetical protein
MAYPHFSNLKVSVTDTKTIRLFRLRIGHGARGNKCVCFCRQRIDVILQEPREAEGRR